MKQHTRSGFVGVLIGVAFLWSVGGTISLSGNPFSFPAGLAKASSHQDSSKEDAKAVNPCNPRNPCNPCGTGGQAVNPCNPCNPCGTAGKAVNPCNPRNPCNPCGTAGQAVNPCNPCNPCGTAGKAVNPCNPCAAGVKQVGFGEGKGETLAWGKDYKTWNIVSGFVKSPSHGNRLVQTFITPPEAAEIYRWNSERARQRRTGEFRPYPPGTRIVQESWVRNDMGAPGLPGPVFFMRKEKPGYDPAGGDWHYGMARTDLSIIGEGKSKAMAICNECHAQARSRDFVFSTDR